MVSGMHLEFTEPVWVPGGLAVDDRGQVRYGNDLDLSPYKRLYFVENHVRGFVRAWHGHQKESKAVMVVRGAAVVAAVAIDDWDSPSADLHVFRYTLSANAPGALLIPPGYANGSMMLTAGACLMYLSDKSLPQALDDDFRYPSRYWDPWTVEER